MHSPDNHGYLILFRGTNWHHGMSYEDVQSVMGDWANWVQRLSQQGKLASAAPLENEGFVITGKNRSIADGPFAESKEAVGGYFYLKVDSIEEAVEIAKECPALPHGIHVEVRPIAPACPVGRMLGDAAAAQVHAMV